MNKDFKNKLFFLKHCITLTNVVSMSYKNKASLDDFIKMYQKNSPKLYPNVEMLMLIKLTDAMPFLSQFTQMKKQGLIQKSLLKVAFLEN